LIVDLISTKRASKLIVISAFSLNLNKLIKLISASHHQQLIVAYANTNSKIYLIFGEECRTFCEGELRQHIDANDDGIVARQLTRIFDDDSNDAPAPKLIVICDWTKLSLIF